MTTEELISFTKDRHLWMTMTRVVLCYMILCNSIWALIWNMSFVSLR